MPSTMNVGAYPALLTVIEQHGWRVYLFCRDQVEPARGANAWDTPKIWTLEVREADELIIKVISDEQGNKAFQQLGLYGATALSRSGRA